MRRKDLSQPSTGGPGGPGLLLFALLLVPLLAGPARVETRMGPGSPLQPTSLKDQISIHTVTLPQPLAASSSSWCTWGSCSISPRLYHAPLSDGRTLVGWTDSGGDGHVSVLESGGSLGSTFHFAARSLRGLVAHSDGSFAVLLWDAGAKIMWLSRRNSNGTEVWTTNIDGSQTHFDASIGDSRLAYGNGLYGAYFAVYGDSGPFATHNGDQLTYVNDSGAVQSGGWEWGCSHSMAGLISYHPVLAKFSPVCSSDCYYSKGILVNNSQVVFPCDGNCAGKVSAQLGQTAFTSSAWLVIFNALDQTGYTGKGIGLATLTGTFSSTFVWLTNTSGDYERDPVMARIGTSLSSNEYLVGRKTTNNNTYWMGRIDAGGNFLQGPEEISSAGISWGNRDDSMQTRATGDVSWVQGDPSSTSLRLFIYSPGSTVYSISGRVRDASSNGIGGVTVGADGKTATSDTDGYYTISGVSAGTHWVGASKSGYRFLPMLAQVTVPPSATGIDFVGHLVYSISGRVTDGAGHGIQNVSISGGLLPGNTDADGNYTLLWVTAGNYTVTPSRSGYTFSPPSRTVAVPPSATAVDFTGSARCYLPVLIR